MLDPWIQWPRFLEPFRLLLNGNSWSDISFHQFQQVSFVYIVACQEFPDAQALMFFQHFRSFNTLSISIFDWFRFLTHEILSINSFLSIKNHKLILIYGPLIFVQKKTRYSSSIWHLNGSTGSTRTAAGSPRSSDCQRTERNAFRMAESHSQLKMMGDPIWEPVRCVGNRVNSQCAMGNTRKWHHF